MLLNCGVKTLESPLDCKEIQPGSSYRKSVRSIHWKDWFWSRISNTFTTWCKELTQLKRPWCWDRWKARAEGNNRGWDWWMASLTQWTWIWGKLQELVIEKEASCVQYMGSQRFRHDCVTELNSTNVLVHIIISHKISLMLWDVHITKQH